VGNFVGSTKLSYGQIITNFVEYIHAWLFITSFVTVCLVDKDFGPCDLCDEDEDYMPMPSSQASTSQLAEEEGTMKFMTLFADALFLTRN
jgi:hypothetical protein